MTDTNTNKAGSPAKSSPDYSNMQHHELAELFPEMSTDEFDALKDDIKANGLRVPITTLDGKILDGRNRYKACVAIYHMLKPEDFTQFQGPKSKALEFVISTNVLRRHLNESQRAVIGGKLVTTTLGSNQYSSGNITIEKAAKLLCVSEASVKTAKKLLEKGGPGVQQAVQTGKRRLGRVAGWLDKSHADQLAELNKPRAPKAAAKQTEKEPPVNQRMTAVDQFVKNWEQFDVMQKQVFVEKFLDELAGMAEQIKAKNAWQQKQQAAA
jgi:hypothetical protein